MSWPKVQDEFATIAKIREGFSVARFGDGEFKLIDFKDQVREPRNSMLARELRRILTKPDSRCLVAIPTMNPDGAKIENWSKHRKRFEQLMSPRIPTYYSAFISRPDSAQWIRCTDYARQYQRVWAGKRVVVVCEAEGSALRAIECGAREIVHIECPTHRTYKTLPTLIPSILKHKPELVILSCGPAATCAAHRLATMDIQAIDFGSGGAFLAKLLTECSP